jgi:soluble lytic murein transglycosylase
VQVLAASPLSFYGINASFETGTKTEQLIESRIPKVEPVEPYLNPAERIHLERSRKLVASNAGELAALELRQISPRANFSSGFLLYLSAMNQAVGNHLSVFQAADELMQRNDPDIVSSWGLRMIFPVEYRELIQKYAKEEGVDPLVVLSLMKQESAFDSRIASSSGAQGLMQLMPATAVEVDGSIELSTVVVPEENIRLGTRYIAQMIKKFNGNIAMALGAYNAGPHRMVKWVRAMRPEWGLREFIESIPYKETRGYVGSIIRNYFWYTYLIHGKRLENFDYFWGAAGPMEFPAEI